MRSVLPFRTAALLLAGLALTGCGLFPSEKSYDSVDKLLEDVEAAGLDCDPAGHLGSSPTGSERSTCGEYMVLSVYELEHQPMEERDHLDRESGGGVHVLVGKNWTVVYYVEEIRTFDDLEEEIPELQVLEDKLGGKIFKVARQEPSLP